MQFKPQAYNKYFAVGILSKINICNICQKLLYIAKQQEYEILRWGKSILYFIQKDLLATNGILSLKKMFRWCYNLMKAEWEAISATLLFDEHFNEVVSGHQ